MAGGDAKRTISRDYKKILEANNTPAPVTIRANTLKTTPQKLCEALTGKGINAVADGDIITLPNRAI
jgi:16S rRNA C967 or C1407 C5-methylase (RsmB/RsmF family)